MIQSSLNINSLYAETILFAFCCDTFSVLSGVKNNHVTRLCSEKYIQDKLDGTVRNIYIYIYIKMDNFKHENP